MLHVLQATLHKPTGTCIPTDSYLVTHNLEPEKFQTGHYLHNNTLTKSEPKSQLYGSYKMAGPKMWKGYLLQYFQALQQPYKHSYSFELAIHCTQLVRH